MVEPVLTPEETLKAKDSEIAKLRDENAKRRLAVEDTEKKFSQLSNEAEDLRKSVATGNSEAKAEIAKLKADLEKAKGGDGSAAQVAELTRQLGEFQTKWQDAEKKATTAEESNRQKTYKTGLTDLVGTLDVVDPVIAHSYLKEFTRLGADGVLELRTTGEDGKERWIAATKENVEKAKLLRPSLLKSAGVPGSGSPRVLPVTADGQALDMERWKTDSVYYEKNREAIKAVMASRLQPSQ